MKRTLLLATLSVFLVASMAGIAHAHPAYKDSSPGWDDTVSSPPSEVWVEFTERIEGGSITITDPCGGRSDHGEDEMNLTKDRLTTGMHGDKAGTYLVKWAVLGSDSHQTKGEFTFTSSGGGKCPGEEPKDPTDEPKEPRDDDRRPRQTDDDDIASSDPNRRESRTETNHRDRDHRNRERANEDKTRVKRKRVARDVAQAPNDGTDLTADKGIWDGIPMGDFFIALGVAALIGAAGGRMYAGIVGPRR